jgi:aspartate-semialdehyde dehydrogenase
VGFNLVPQVGPFLANSPWTEEEAGWTLEAARLFAPKGEVPVVAGTAVQVPSFFGHGLSLHVRLKKPAPVDQVRATLKGSPALKVLDSPGEKVYPMPSLVTADPTVHVGRLRSFPQAPEWLSLFATVDNAGRGAALNLVEAGLRLAERPA